MSTFHTPVFLKEVIEGLKVKEGGKYIDATIGGGGHGVEIVKRGGKLLGIDADSDALEFAKEKLEVKLIHRNFRDIEQIAKTNGFEKVDGILFDLGVSSHQLDTPARGFSYRFPDAPLDMRLSDTTSVTASDIVNTYSEEELYEIFARFGEEQLARPLAHALVGARHMKAIVTTGDLINVISRLVSDQNHLSATLSRIFQAIRIVVNDELGALKAGLAGAAHILQPGGRIAVISFHSLEDRIVKQFLQGASWTAVTKRPMVASDDEVARNPRARSAKLRIGERL
jgi:16S rRNA (cytosine1402-N4)-methyltransferase